MRRSLTELIDRVEAGIERLLGEMSAMSEAQRGFRPTDDAWSPNQVAHHLLKVQEMSVAAIEKYGERPSSVRSLKQRLGKVAVYAVLRFGIKVRNPAPPTTPGRDITFAELEPRWVEELERLRRLVGPLDDSRLGNAGMKHPISGPLTLAESLDFLSCHLEHHLRQLERLRSDRAFPS